MSGGERLGALIAAMTRDPDAEEQAAFRRIETDLISVIQAADWISLADMDQEDHKSHRKFERLQKALRALDAKLEGGG